MTGHASEFICADVIDGFIEYKRICCYMLMSWTARKDYCGRIVFRP